MGRSMWEDITGKIFKSNGGEDVLVLERIFKEGARDSIYKVRFNNGYEGIFTKSNIQSGKILNPTYDEIVGKVFTSINYGGFKVLRKTEVQNSYKNFLSFSSRRLPLLSEA